jgi:hypothetical protein
MCCKKKEQNGFATNYPNLHKMIGKKIRINSGNSWQKLLVKKNRINSGNSWQKLSVKKNRINSGNSWQKFKKTLSCEQNQLT